jgi:putative protease
MAEQEGELIGRVTHYFAHVGVAVIELTGVLKVGDTIKIVGGETEFTQPVDSMEVEHQKIQQAKKGDSIGLKINQKVKDSYKVYRL